MRVAIILLILCQLQLSSKSFGQSITLKGKDISLGRIFVEIRKQTGYDVLMNNTSSNLPSLTINFKQAPLRSVLDEILKGTQYQYSIVGKSVVLEERKTNVRTATIQTALIDVKGRLVDEKGNPLANASIQVQGSKTSTSSNPDGSFQLKQIHEKSILIISFLGYEVQRLRAVFDLGQITMILAPAALEEVKVVNTGYQTISKERSAGSYAKPEMSIFDNRTGSMNILQRLDGLIAGLTVNNSPGASQNQLLVRGLSTIGLQDDDGLYSGTNRTPLIVVDGIPISDASSINPQDVADITVLKDATAASIWGSRASNGVIVISTKKGRKGEKVSVNYNAFINFQGKPDLNYFKTLNSQQFIQAAAETFDPVINPWPSVYAFSVTGGTGVAPHERILYDEYLGLISTNQARTSLDSLSQLDNRQQIKDLWYRNASLMNHSLSISTGSEKYSAYASAAYTSNNNNRPGDSNNAYKINLRQDFSLGKYVQLNLITDINHERFNGKRNININSNFYPYQLFRDAAGKNLSIPYMGELSEEDRIEFQKLSKLDLNYNPLDEFNYGHTTGNKLLSRNILGLQVKLYKDLQFEGTYGFIKGSGKTEEYDDTKSYLVRSELAEFTVAPEIEGASPIYYLPKQGGRFSDINNNQQYWTVRNQLSYNTRWDQDLHQLSVLVGQEIQEQLEQGSRSTVRGYNELLMTYDPIDYATLRKDGVYDPVMPNSWGASFLTNDQFRRTERLSRFTSYYANSAYTYRMRYAINGSVRIDKSNLFGLDKSAQNRPVWSIGAKWIASAEDFLRPFTWINHFALRATYGLTGNSPEPGTAASYDILESTSSGFLPGGVGVRIAAPSNRKLTWESTQNTNLGLDFALLGNRISGSLDLYKKKTVDLLGSVPNNSLSGYSSIIGNLGDLENKGLELSLNTLNIAKGPVTWRSIFNIAYNKNKITRLNLNAPIMTANERVRQQFIEGYSAFALFAYTYAGLDELGDPQIELKDGSISKTPHIGGVDDVRYMGTYQPIWSGGMTHILNYKNLSLSANVIFNLGHKMRRDVNQQYTFRIMHSNAKREGFTTGNLHEDFANRWKAPGDEQHTDIPSYVSNSSLSSSRRDFAYYTFADINVVNASYIKLRDISLGYELPSAWIERIKTDQIRLHIQLSNLMLWKANKNDIDPEYIHAMYGNRSLLSNQGTLSLGVQVKF